MIRKIVSAICYVLLRRLPKADLPQFALDLLAARRLVLRLQAAHIDCVLDVGAHHGWFAHRLRKAGYDGRIISFEPFPESADQIESKSRNDDRWSTLRYALGDQNGLKEFNVLLTPSGGTTMNSFLQPTIGFAEVKKVDVEIRRFDSIAGELFKNIENPRIFLKMDTQGYDLAVLNGMGEWLDRVQLMQSEVSLIPIYEGMPHYTEALEEFERRKFAVLEMQPVGYDNNGRVLEFDCIMARAEDLTALSP